VNIGDHGDGFCTATPSDGLLQAQLILSMKSTTETPKKILPSDFLLQAMANF
jgi:hypothetical protein